MQVAEEMQSARLQVPRIGYFGKVAHAQRQQPGAAHGQGRRGQGAVDQGRFGS